MTIDLSTIVKHLKSFASRHHLSSGRKLHTLLIKAGHLPSLFPSNSLLQFYSRCSPNPKDAQNLFDSMADRNPFSFNTLVDSYLNSNDTATAIALFRENPEKNSYSWTAMITGLVKCGELDNARQLFDEMHAKDATALNSLIHGYLRCGKALEGFLLYRREHLDDKFVLTTVVSGCANHQAYDLGKQIHARIIVAWLDFDSVLASALVDMYGKCEDLDNACRVLDLMECPDEFSLSALVTAYSNAGRVEDARMVFDKKRNRGVVLWNSMISGFVFNELGEEALHLFNEMMREARDSADSSTFACILSGCASLGVLETGMQVHACGLKHGILEDVVVATALVDSYSKCGEWEDACRVFNETRVRDTILLNSMINVYSNYGMTDEARRVFNSISNKTIISWNSMVVGYSQNGCVVEALDLFVEMRLLNLKLDKVALASAISASASLCAFRLGEQLFSLATIIGLESNPIISTSVIDLYCKCGNVADGWKLFYSMKSSDTALWNSMMMGYASNGYGNEVLMLFESMINSSIVPNEVTFIAVLSGCCHSGLVEEGLQLFYRMKKDYNVDPKVEHYSLVIDSLVRAGQIEEAIEFIDTMPFEADESMWTSVLGGCKARGDEYLGNKILDRLVKLAPRQAGPYVQISSVYAARGKWEASEKIRRTMQNRRIQKNPGYSWIDN